jgi:hypothetical protein
LRIWNILVTGSHVEGSLWNEDHAVRVGLVPLFTALYSDKLTAVSAAAAAQEHYCEGSDNQVFHAIGFVTGDAWSGDKMNGR